MPVMTMPSAAMRRGVECPSFQTVKSEVIAGLVEVAVELLPASEGRKLAIEVRDEAGRHVFTTMLILEVEIPPGERELIFSVLSTIDTLETVC